MNVRELLTFFGFEVDDEGAKSAEKVYKGIRSLALGVAATAAAAAAAVALITKETADVGDAAKKTGERLGITATEVQELAYAAKTSGVEFETLKSGMRSLQRQAGEAANGNKNAAKAFARVGVSVHGANGQIKPATQLLEEVADGLASIPDEGKRTAVAMKLMREAGSEMLPFLLKGSAGIRGLRDEAERLGGVLSDEDAAAAEEFNDSLDDLSFTVRGVRLRFGRELLPTFTRTVNTIKELIVQNRALIDKGIKYVTGGIIKLVDWLSQMAIWAARNRRFLAIFGALAGGYAALNILKLASAFGILRLEFIKSVLVMGAQFIIIVGLIAIVAILIEDILKGGKGLRRLRDYLLKEAQKPDANWMVKVLAKIVEYADRAYKSVDFLFKNLAEEANGDVWKALKIAGETAIDFWIKKLRTFLFYLKVGTQAILHPFDTLESIVKPYIQDPIYREIAKDRLFVQDPNRFDPGRVPIRSGGGSQTNIGGPQINVKVNPAAGSDANAIGKQTAKEVRKALEDWVGTWAPEFDFGVER